MLDFYAGWAHKEPKSTGGNVAVYELAYARYGDPKYLAIAQKVGRPINLGTGKENSLHCIFGPITLTHARDSYGMGTTAIASLPARGGLKGRVTAGLPAEGLAAGTLFADPRFPGVLHIMDGRRLRVKAE